MKSDFLHPTTRGGQIRTLGMLRRLHQRHEVHYVCLDDGSNNEGLARSGEYCSKAYPIRHFVPSRRSFSFALQLAGSLSSDLPLAVSRYRSARMKQRVAAMMAAEQFDALVCDFLFPAPNVPNLSDAILFQHNVEAVIWRRHALHARNAVERAYFSLQASRMEVYERAVCRAARHVIAVSQADCRLFKEKYGVAAVSGVPTGVDLAYFTPPEDAPKQAALVFTGSMDWLPNVDGARFFLEQIYPHIARELPECTVAFAGRNPDPSLIQAARRFPKVIVTRTVDDIRPWLWGSTVAIVPLRIGGGTRLKIYEAMAARTPVVSTTVGAEGLPLENDRHLLIEDDPKLFAEACVRLLRDAARRRELTSAAWALIAEKFSWEAAAEKFESILSAHALRQPSGLVTAG